MKLLINNKTKIQKLFKNVLRLCFDSKIEQMDFKNSSSVSRKVNDWIKQKTNNKIQEIIQPGDIDSHSSLILLNTLYFNGVWQQKFASIGEGKFTLFNGSSITVPIMTVQGDFRYQKRNDLHAEIIEIPYITKNSSDTISMNVIIPNEGTNLADVENKIKNKDFSISNTERISITLYVPKFKIESTINIRDSLVKLGFANIFDRNVDLFLIVRKQLQISKIVQKVVIEVTEDGTEENAVPPYPGWEGTVGKEMYVDRPFLIQIRTKNVILFTGRVFNPNLEISSQKNTFLPNITTRPPKNNRIVSPDD